MTQILNQTVLKRDPRIVIHERVASELENELIPHGAVEWANVTELSHSRERDATTTANRTLNSSGCRLLARATLGGVGNMLSETTTQ